MNLIIKNTLRIIRDYNITLVKIFFFEFIYLVKDYKGFKFNFSTNNTMTNNIPCPYYFLFRIKKHFKKNNFQKLYDLGCGSGRIIDFFNRDFPNKEFVGIEYFSKQFEHCKKRFHKNNNIEIIQGDFTKIDFMINNPDYLFLTDPFKNSSDFLNFMEKIINLTNRKLFFIIVNTNKETIGMIKNITVIDSFYISKNSGYSICSSTNVKKI